MSASSTTTCEGSTRQRSKIAREAREVSGREVFIAGAIGPLGDARDAHEDEHAIYAEQAELLEGRGVDLFTVETFFDAERLLTAIAAVRSVSSLPIVALLTFDEDALTLGGVRAEDAAAKLADQDVVAIGANHSAGPQAALRAIEQMRGAGKPSGGTPERRPREPRGPADRLPTRDPRVLRRVHRSCTRARRSDHRRLLRVHPGRDRGDPAGRRRAPASDSATRRSRTHLRHGTAGARRGVTPATKARRR